MLSLAVKFPDTVRTNDHWRQHHPQMVADAGQKTLARLWTTDTHRSTASEPFDLEMEPYLADPFRGARERRVLLPGEQALSLQVAAGRDALAAAGLGPEGVDLTIVSTFYADKLDTGNAAFVVRDLGLGGTAFNLETACSSSVVAFHTACGLIRAGLYKRVLVVVACSYSHVLDETDTLAWFLADGAGAFVVGDVPEGEGFISMTSEHTADTCGVFFTELEADPVAGPRLRMRADRRAGEVLRDTSAVHLRSCCRGAAAAAGVTLADIDFFVFNTPTAWFAAFAARALGIDPARTISNYHRYANIGPAHMPANLFHAAHEGRIKKGDLVMLYAVGSVSSASAVVMRWGDVALGPPPP
jgi:3-oxoacyl-[acyl-carrier-protein] synthase-3